MTTTAATWKKVLAATLVALCVCIHSSSAFVTICHHPRKINVIFQALVETVTEDDGTVYRLEDEQTGQLITLIGTAHLSEKSNEQVRSIIQEANPDIVLVELDPKRLERVGFDNPQDIGIPYITVENIDYPETPEDIEFKKRRSWWSPLQGLFLDAFTKIARKFITGMYNDMGEAMGGQKGGGEFLVAIEAAKETNKCKKVVLGDRDSFLTIRRAAELALRSGKPFDVLGRLSNISQEEMSALEDRVVRDLGLEEADESEITIAVMEALKQDPIMRDRLFERLEKEVPEFATGKDDGLCIHHFLCCFDHTYTHLRSSTSYYVCTSLQHF
jgi:hypothetical protein